MKSHEAAKKERRVLVRTSIEEGASSMIAAVPQTTTMDQLVKQLQGEKAVSNWQIKKDGDDQLKVELRDDIHGIPKYTVVVNSGLEFTVFVYNWPVPDDHLIYKERSRCARKENIIELLVIVEHSSLCEGLPPIDEVLSIAVDPTAKIDNPPQGTVFRHSIPKVVNNEEANFQSTVSYRSVDCKVIVNDECVSQPQLCQPCTSTLNATKRASRRKSKASAEPAKSRAPLSACGPEKLKATVQATRVECKQLEDHLQEMQRKIEQEGVGVSRSLETDLLKIMGRQSLEATPHMKFFWEQQMALLQTEKMGRRYHPQIIRFALSVHAKSPAAYREIRESGALILPSERVLRDYKNYFKPKAGINVENIESLKEKTKEFTSVQRYVAIVMDEMKIQSNLVFDKVSGDLIGFIDLGDPMTNTAFLDEDVVATHALVFLVRGLCTDLKHVIAYYFTGDVTSYQLMPMFWKAVSVLELSLNLWVCAAVNDGASPNRKFFRLHSNLAKDMRCDIAYKTINVFAMLHFIYFFADSPHLMKTARNCLYSSGYGLRTCYMWNNGHHILFQHIADLFYQDQEHALHTLPKLTLDHIMLMSYSKMKVNLAIQILSKSVMIALQESDSEEVLETARFCGMMNNFFDCTNVRSRTEHISKRNEFIKPYTSIDDERFTWLVNVFLKYLEEWRQQTQERPGHFTPQERAKMFLSQQTYEGLKIAVYSHIEAIQFLIAQGFQYVLSERFMQDVLEDYFGHQRSQGRRSDNPTAYQFGYNDLTIAAQRDIAPVIRGNFGGRYGKEKWYQVSDEPVNKRKKEKPSQPK
jgi:hypothetical protein